MSSANTTWTNQKGEQATWFETAVTVLFAILASLVVASLWRWLSTRRTWSVAYFGRGRMMSNGTSAAPFG
jgi:hypothetical protein